MSRKVVSTPVTISTRLQRAQRRFMVLPPFASGARVTKSNHRIVGILVRQFSATDISRDLPGTSQIFTKLCKSHGLRHLDQCWLVSPPTYSSGRAGGRLRRQVQLRESWQQHPVGLAESTAACFDRPRHPCLTQLQTGGLGSACTFCTRQGVVSWIKIGKA